MPRSAQKVLGGFCISTLIFAIKPRTVSKGKPVGESQNHDGQPYLL
jgi:hypothetical protein